MQIKLRPAEEIEASIKLPSSKSISNRVLIINALSMSKYVPENVSECDDTRVMLKALGSDDQLVDIMAAGTAMRFLTAYYASQPGERKCMTGTSRMLQRPIRVLVDALRELGAQIEYAGVEGYPPLLVEGKRLNVNRVSLQGHVSSQYISALLMIAPIMESGLRLILEGELISRPYIDLTLSLMKEFGAEAAWLNEHEIEVSPKPYTPIPFRVESDWSAASYWYEIVALSNDRGIRVNLPELHELSYQGDSAVAGLFAQLGVLTQYNRDGSVTLQKGGHVVSHMTYDFLNQPDLAQTFVVTCCMLGVHFRFTGLQSLKIKETDRIAALITEMRKLGFIIAEEFDSVLYWNGECCDAEPEAAIDTYEDHRMAMAFAPACLTLGILRINNPHVVSKSYPRFWEDLCEVGFQISNE